MSGNVKSHFRCNLTLPDIHLHHMDTQTNVNYDISERVPILTTVKRPYRNFESWLNWQELATVQNIPDQVVGVDIKVGISKTENTCRHYQLRSVQQESLCLTMNSEILSFQTVIMNSQEQLNTAYIFTGSRVKAKQSSISNVCKPCHLSWQNIEVNIPQDHHSRIK